ncbi:unnamed protein product [Polarella glacialis]|uniref:Uncharacterized protein n=1 Tax=Polarella glacialis TaxID=89957 RepID=A0A813JXK4_POLGL|nr:unnamed protein product [Polarella glacialis]
MESPGKKKQQEKQQARNNGNQDGNNKQQKGNNNKQHLFVPSCLFVGCFSFVSSTGLLTTWVFINNHFTAKPATVFIWVCPKMLVPRATQKNNGKNNNNNVTISCFSFKRYIWTLPYGYFNWLDPALGAKDRAEQFRPMALRRKSLQLLRV